MATWFLLSVGLFIAFYSGSNGENCSLALAALQSSAFDTNTGYFEDCPALQKLLEERENLTEVRKENSWLKKLLLNVTTESNSTLNNLVQEFNANLTQIRKENEQLTTELASNSIIPTPEAVIVHTEHNENLTLNCSIVIPQRYQDVNISLMRDGENMLTDWNEADVTARNVTNPGLQMWYRVFDRCHPVPLNLTGDFTCVMHAASPVSSASPASYSTTWTIPVVVHEPLKVAVIPKVEATVGEEVTTISCYVSGNPIPKEVTWSLKEKTNFHVIARNDPNLYRQTSGPEMEYSRVFYLMIMKPKLDMEGYVYNCSVHDSLMNRTFSNLTTLSVKKKERAIIQIVQNPNLAHIHGSVTINCSVTSKQDISEMNWKYSNNKRLDKNEPGVLEPPDSRIQGKIGYSILKLSVENKDGKDWPKDVICEVDLILGDDAEDAQSVAELYTVIVTDAVIPQPSPTSSSAVKTTTTTLSTTMGHATTLPTASSTSTATPIQGNSPVGVTAIAVAIVVVLVLGGVVFMVYWKRHMLRDWLMDKDVVKVMQKGKRGKGYKYSKLPKDISTSMKHLE